jgi:hypothetical protein
VFQLLFRDMPARVGMSTAWLRTVNENYPAETAPDFVIIRISEVVEIIKESY